MGKDPLSRDTIGRQVYRILHTVIPHFYEFIVFKLVFMTFVQISRVTTLQFLIKTRLYHYATTNLPMPPHAILQPSTEDQVDPPWLMTKICRMIDEFTDVNEGEKEFVKMWNLHVQHYT